MKDRHNVKVVYDDEHEEPEWACIDLNGFRFRVSPIDNVEKVADGIRSFVADGVEAERKKWKERWNDSI